MDVEITIGDILDSLIIITNGPQYFILFVSTVDETTTISHYSYQCYILLLLKMMLVS